MVLLPHPPPNRNFSVSTAPPFEQTGEIMKSCLQVSSEQKDHGPAASCHQEGAFCVQCKDRGTMFGHHLKTVKAEFWSRVGNQAHREPLNSRASSQLCDDHQAAKLLRQRTILRHSVPPKPQASLGAAQSS